MTSDTPISAQSSTDISRLSLLNDALVDCKPYAAFKAICGIYGLLWSSDSDVERFEAAATRLCGRPVIAEELCLSPSTSHWPSWIFVAQRLLAKSLRWESAPVETKSDFPLVVGSLASYFPDKPIEAYHPDVDTCEERYMDDEGDVRQ